MTTEQRAVIERVEAGMEDMRQGKMVILVDDENRENEGDLVAAAEKITPEIINFMVRFGRGVLCLALTGERCDQLGLQMMVPVNKSAFCTAFTVSIESAEGVTTGVSAADRAHTIKTAVAPNAKPSDIASPGHIFPLRARDGGVLVRTGQTEGSVDLARLAGLTPAGVICEVMNDDGTMARRPQLEVMAAEHGLRILSVADIIEYRLLRERLVERVTESELTIPGVGDFRAVVYRSLVDDSEHLALVKGHPSADHAVLGRVHQANGLSDIFGITASGTVDGRQRILWALRQIEEAGEGVLVYLTQKDVTLSTLLGQKTQKNPKNKGSIGLPVELCEFGIGAQILLDQGVRQIRLLTTTPSRIKGIEGYGLSVVEQITIPAREE